MGLLRHLVKLLAPLNSLILKSKYGKHQKEINMSYFNFADTAKLKPKGLDRIYEKIIHF